MAPVPTVKRAYPLEALLCDTASFTSRQVRVAAYYMSHCEGDWICSDQRDPLNTAMSLSFERACAVFRADCSSTTRDRLEWYEGRPAMIIGTFRVGTYYGGGGPASGPYSNHPFLVVSQIRETVTNDPNWAVSHDAGLRIRQKRPWLGNEPVFEDGRVTYTQSHVVEVPATTPESTNTEERLSTWPAP